MITPQAIQVSELDELESHRHRCPHLGCTSTFSRKSDLRRHDRTHTQLRPYRCEWPECEKAFNQKGQLKTHKNTHTGEKPHQCDLCSKRFSDPASRTRHRKEAHGGHRTNQCHLCHSRIKRMRSFYVHLRDKHGIEWSSEMKAGRQRRVEDAPILMHDISGPPQRSPRRGAYVTPMLDTHSQWESGDSPSHLHDTPASLYPGTSYRSSGAFKFRQGGKVFPSWQQSPRAVSPFQGLSFMPSPDSYSTASSSSVPHLSREFSPAESQAGSVVSSESSLYIPLHTPDANDSVEPANPYLGRYDESLPLERQLHAQNLRMWQSDMNCSKGKSVPIDPTLLSNES